MGSRVENVGLVAVLVLGLTGCATSRVENQMPSCSLLNLDSVDLRDAWTEEDFEFLLRQKERLFALIAVHGLPPGAPIDNNFELEHEFVLINQRQPTPADMHEGYVHPRDLPLTGAAYRALIGRVQEYVASGAYTLPPDWRERFPDLAAYYDQGHVPNISSYPTASC